MYDYLIVGAGFSALVAAERLCTQHNKRCLVVEKRDHIGGSAYTENNKIDRPKTKEIAINLNKWYKPYQ